MIVACGVTQQLNDKQQLTPLVEAVEKNLGARPAQVLADAGYWNEEQVAANAPRGPRAAAMRERLCGTRMN